VGADSSSDRGSLRNWLESSRFNTCEASDIFQALEQISDFSVRERPDVVLLEVESPQSEYALYQRMMDETLYECEPAVLALAGDAEKTSGEFCFEGNLAQVASRLEGMIPSNLGVAA